MIPSTMPAAPVSPTTLPPMHTLMDPLPPILGILGLAGLAVGAAAAEPRLLADFENGSYGDWEVAGEAFGDRPATGTLPLQHRVSGFRGRGFVNSYLGGDKSVGMMTSPEFRIEHDYLGFLIAGGDSPETALQLLVGEEVVATASGRNTEKLEPRQFDLRPHRGRMARVRILDRKTTDWGHVNVDHIELTDQRLADVTFRRREKSFTVDKNFLVLPIRDNGGKASTIELLVDGKGVRRYDIRLADSPGNIDWHAFFTIEAYRGQEARVVAGAATEPGFALVRQADTVPGSESWYREAHRPRFHFTQAVGWNNDPNGMVHHDGTWHLFFQHNPVGLQWGNMTWGHATSTDLLHWEQQPNKLFPGALARGACHSGGAVVDTRNTAGWGPNTLVAFFTDNAAGEAAAYSTDGGETFTYYDGNPLISFDRRHSGRPSHKGRDPNVFWYAYDQHDSPLDDAAKRLGGHWVMAVYDEDPRHGGRNIAFYTSTDMKAWTERSHLPGYYECPDLIELPLDGNPADTRWVVFAADARYAIGAFDGKTFTPAGKDKHQVHWGAYYASQTFDNAPDGRRIQMGWVKVDAPGPYNQHFSFPHELTLRTTREGIRMFAEPVAEIAKLRTATRRLGKTGLAAGRPATLAVETDLLDVQLKAAVGDAGDILLDIPGHAVRYNAAANRLENAELHPVDGVVTIRVLADRSLTEIIGNDGRVYISRAGDPNARGSRISVTAQGGDATLLSLEAHELKSIW